MMCQYVLSFDFICTRCAALAQWLLTFELWKNGLEFGVHILGSFTLKYVPSHAAHTIDRQEEITPAEALCVCVCLSRIVCVCVTHFVCTCVTHILCVCRAFCITSPCVCVFVCVCVVHDVCVCVAHFVCLCLCVCVCVAYVVCVYVCVAHFECMCVARILRVCVCRALCVCVCRAFYKCILSNYLTWVSYLSGTVDVQNALIYVI